MEKKELIVSTFLGILLVAAISMSGCAGGPNKEVPPATPLPTITPAPTAELSEQPDEATFREYFSDIGLGRLAAGGKFPEDLQRNVAVFTSSDEVCIYGTLTQEVLVSVAIYDTVAEEFAQPKQAFPSTLKKGGFASCSSIPPAGEYEYRVYVGDVLVAVLPFEVIEQPSVETSAEVSRSELEIWITKGKDYQTRCSTMTSEETKDARVWVKGPEGGDISFQIWCTFPSGNRVPYVDDGRTDLSGKPACCGGFAQTLSPGNYTFEVVIDDAVAASTTLEVAG